MKEQCRYQRQKITAFDGIELTLHSWIAVQEKGVIFYVHGMQSNGTWLFETGPFLSNRGLSVHVLDRRGSGFSEGIRGDVNNIDVLMKDYSMAFQFVKSNSKTANICVMGQSLGGSILLGLIINNFISDFSKVIFCSAALGQLHNRLSDEAMKDRLVSEGKTLHDVNLAFEKYSNCEKYISFMKNKSTAINRITSDSQRVFLQVENTYYYAKKKQLEDALFVAPRNDLIIDIKKSREVYHHIFPKGLFLELPVYEHYIEFTDYRFILWNIIIMYILGGNIYV